MICFYCFELPPHYSWSTYFLIILCRIGIGKYLLFEVSCVDLKNQSWQLKDYIKWLRWCDNLWKINQSFLDMWMTLLIRQNTWCNLRLERSNLPDKSMADESPCKEALIGFDLKHENCHPYQPKHLVQPGVMQ